MCDINLAAETERRKFYAKLADLMDEVGVNLNATDDGEPYGDHCALIEVEFMRGEYHYDEFASLSSEDARKMAKMINMRGNHRTTIDELGADSSLEIEIDYHAIPGEKPVRYYPDGSGYPGSPPTCELISVYVERWGVHDAERKRDDHWAWGVLDQIAFDIVSDEWEHYQLGCLEDAAERIGDER